MKPGISVTCRLLMVARIISLVELMWHYIFLYNIEGGDMCRTQINAKNPGKKRAHCETARIERYILITERSYQAYLSAILATGSTAFKPRFIPSVEALDDTSGMLHTRSSAAPCEATAC